MSIYDEMRAEYNAELAQHSEQGEMVYLEPGTPAGPEWDPVPGTPTEHPVLGFKRSGKRKHEYVADGYIVATDTLVQTNEFGVTPTMDGQFKINGKTFQIVMIDPITEAVPPIGWYIGCRS